ncbi:DUF4350 domain-containing protein [Methanoregula sp.]|uniref:DUF4350 domain-containing protein n=1 Tax=Methanoregula sp. TaxID=2052170 RepID=UPI0025E3919B|nr:DUF4350 domain-containing protein [Methanoregula sp.]
MKIIKAAYWIVGIVLLMAALILATHLTSNNLDFSQYNPDWNGTSRFFSDLDRHHTVMVQDSAQLASYRNNALLLIIAPERSPTGAEITAYQAFLDRGNTIVLADDFGTGREILQRIRSRITILDGNLSSIDREYADPYTIVVYPVENASPVENCGAIVMDRPAPLDGGEPLVMTSILSWVDTNGDRRININEVMGEFPVISAEEISRGRIVVISDPSIFINSMQDIGDRWGNRCLLNNLIHYNGTVLVDQMNSRTRDAEGMSGIFHVLRTQFIVEVLFFGFLVLVAAWAWREKIL